MLFNLPNFYKMELSKFLLLPCLLLISCLIHSKLPFESFVLQSNKDKIEANLLLGFWETTDSLKSKIEFIDLKSEIQLTIPEHHPYYFYKDSLGLVSVSGFYPNWPPYDCELKLNTSDTLEITFSQLGITHYLKMFQKVNY